MAASGGVMLLLALNEESTQVVSVTHFTEISPKRLTRGSDSIEFGPYAHMLWSSQRRLQYIVVSADNPTGFGGLGVVLAI